MENNVLIGLTIILFSFGCNEKIDRKNVNPSGSTDVKSNTIIDLQRESMNPEIKKILKDFEERNSWPSTKNGD